MNSIGLRHLGVVALLAGTMAGCNPRRPAAAPTLSAAPPTAGHPPALSPPERLPGACERPPLLAADRHGLTVVYHPSGAPLNFGPAAPRNLTATGPTPAVVRYRPDHTIAWLQLTSRYSSNPDEAAPWLTAVATDSAGNTYLGATIGARANFADTVFRARPCTTSRQEWRHTADPVLIKLDARGRLAWARQLGTGRDGELERETLRAVVADEAGNSYAVGVLAAGGAVPGAPGQRPYTLVAGGSFVASWDAAGRRRWVRPLHPADRGNWGDYGLALTPGARALLVLIPANIVPDSLPPAAAEPGEVNPRRAFQLSRLGAATGVVSWRRRIYAAAFAPWFPSVPHGTSHYVQLTGLAADAAGGAVVAGMAGGVTVGWDAMTPAHPLPDSAHLFVGRYDSAGRGQWVRALHARRYHPNRTGSTGYLLGAAARDSLVWLTGAYYGRPPDVLLAHGWRVSPQQVAHSAFLAAYSLGGELREAYPWPAAPALADSVYRLEIGPPCVPAGGGPGWLPGAYRPAHPVYPPDGSGPKPAPRALLGRWP